MHASVLLLPITMRSFVYFLPGVFQHYFLQSMNIHLKNKGRANFHLIDSESLSVGQGYLVNYVFQQVKNGLSAQLIDENLREMIPNIYTILCSPDLSYLYSNGFLDTGQMIAGEQHAIYPVFSLENGHYNSLEKFKNFHGIQDYFIEFLEEYESLQGVGFHSSPKEFAPHISGYKTKFY